MTNNHQLPGFFPNFLSVVVFTVILCGLFLGFTRIYPQLVNYQRLDVPPPGDEPDIAEEIAPFVRGVLSGVETAQNFSIRSNDSLNANEVKGYQEGIKTALLASKNWYNIDQQLFRTRGIALGVTASVESSKTSQDRGTQAYQIKLIQQIEAALATNLDELLSANDDQREKVLTDYLNALKKLAGEAAIELANMERIIGEANTQVETQTGIAQEYDENFLYNLEPSDDKTLEAYLRARNELDQAAVTVRATGQIRSRLAPLNVRLNQLILAIETNFRALATGSKVLPVEGASVPIFQEQ